jgi:SpoVK/Ycf46/Vps4 family AAA+-type ATPase
MSDPLIKSTIVLERVSNCLDIYRHEYKKDVEVYVAGSMDKVPNSKFPDEQSYIKSKLADTPYKTIERSYGVMEEVGFVGTENNFCILLEKSHRQELIIYITASNDAINKLPNLKEMVERYKITIRGTKEEEVPEVNIICKSEFGLELKSFPIKSNTNEKVSFEDLYNDDFYPVYHRIINAISQQSNERYGNGIILFNGDYGTGKTNLIRHIISSVDKRVIFLPPDMASVISNPNFVKFFLDYPDSVLIIEDAENVLKTREAGGNNAVSNILNLSDGILGDILNLQVICTFNAPIEDIDEALRREGRLIDMYTFTALSEEKTSNLYKKLYGNDAEPPVKEMPLSKIFNDNQHKRNLKSVNEKPTFGFLP